MQQIAPRCPLTVVIASLASGGAHPKAKQLKEVSNPSRCAELHGVVSECVSAFCVFVAQGTESNTHLLPLSLTPPTITGELSPVLVAFASQEWGSAPRRLPKDATSGTRAQTKVVRSIMGHPWSD